MGQYKNVCRNYLHADYLVMPDRFTADIMIDSCDIRTIYQGTIIDAGYPRVDNTLNTDCLINPIFLICFMEHAQLSI